MTQLKEHRRELSIKEMRIAINVDQYAAAAMVVSLRSGLSGSTTYARQEWQRRFGNRRGVPVEELVLWSEQNLDVCHPEVRRYLEEVLQRHVYVKRGGQ